MLWVGFALLAALVVWALLRPLTRLDTASIADRSAGEIAVYRDQLSEIDADRARGLLDEAEAEAARAEVGRRLLKAAEAGEGIPVRGPAGGFARQAATVLGAGVPLAALAIYLVSGSPTLPSRPHEARMKVPVEKANVEELVAKVEAQLRQRPDDGRGWDIIAPVYLKLGRAEDAANAYARALDLNGESEDRLSGFAEASVVAANGVVTDGARRAFTRLVEINPKRFEARFGLAMAKEQDGDAAGAAQDYRAILSSAPADAPWRGVVEGRLAEVGGKPPSVVALPERRGPSSDDVAAASKMAPDERAQKINQMVAGLAERLKADGKDLGGWLQLARSYMVLGRRDDAVAAIAEARKNFAGDQKSLAEIETMAKSLGLGS